LACAQDPLKKSAVNTQAITGPVADTFNLLAGRGQIELTVCDPGFEIVCDRDRLTQVLTNLLDNAFKFSPPNSQVRLSVELAEPALGESTAHSKASLLFKVQDQGKGIAPEHCSQIFERFAQVDASNTRKTGGTGLGLAICRSIIEWHGGRIWAESMPGEGSCFAFILPMS
jgi:signal transduction histidine kinase